MPKTKKPAKKKIITEEAGVDDRPDSPDVEEIIPGKESSELKDWTNDSLDVDCSAHSQCSLHAVRRKKALKAVHLPTTSNVWESNEEEDKE